MLILIKSAPGTREAMRGLRVAKDLSAKLVLMQNGVYFARKGGLEGFTGETYVLDDDLKLRGNLTAEGSVRPISYDELVGLMERDDKVLGMF